MAIHKWQQLTTVNFKQLDPNNTVVLLPLGATEQHGPHLPVGADNMLASAVLRHTLELVTDLELLVLPTLWCTKSNEHMSFPGTLSLRSETMIAVIQDIAYSIARTGLRKLFLLNWHGGNTELLATVARDARLDHNLFVAVVDCLRLAAAVTPEAVGEDASFGLHAGRGETSIMLAAYPDSVRREGLREGRREGPEERGAEVGAESSSREDGWRQLLDRFDDAVSIGWKTSDLSRDGVVGNLEGASEEEGRRYLRLISEKVADALRVIAAFDDSPEGP